MNKNFISNNQKIYQVLFFGIASCLEDVFERRYLADKVLERHFRANKKWGSKDRKIVAESFYEIIKNFSLLSETGKLDCDDQDFYKEITAIYFTLNGYEDAYLKDYLYLSVDALKKNKAEAEQQEHIKFSYPKWLYDLCSSKIKDFDKIAKSLNQHAPVVLRANTLKASVQEVFSKLSEEGFECEIYKNDAIVLRKRQNLFRSKAFADGLFEVQDYSSQMVGVELDVKDGMRVIDACAGAGGKTLHIAALMQNKGRITALDIEQRKLDELKKRARKAGCFNIDMRVIEGTKTIKKLAGAADRLLLDVPCTGLGVLRRNPDRKWKISEEEIERLTKIQYEILRNYSKMVKVGGKMVYSTCSILPAENQDQVQSFLSENSSFKLIKDHTLYPHTDGFDGFYIAVMERIA